MDGLWDFYVNHGFWAWVGLGGVLLAIEVSLGSGYLLWPAAAAGMVAVVVVTGISPGLPAELGLFAILTIASSLLANRFFPPSPATGPDINDTHLRLEGREGSAVGAFHNGRGRVFVEGKEWAAEADADLADGDRVRVVAVSDGATLRVERA